MTELNPIQEEQPEENQNQEGVVQGDTVNITRSGVGQVKANTVNVRQGGLQSVEADQVTIRQGGLLKANTKRLEVLQGGVVYGHAESANLVASNAVAVVAGGEVSLDQTMARVVVAGGDVRMDQSASVAVVARTIRVSNSNPVLLLAQNVEGDVKPMFGPRESLMYGVVSGLVAGVVILIAQMFKKRK